MNVRRPKRSLPAARTVLRVTPTAARKLFTFAHSCGLDSEQRPGWYGAVGRKHSGSAANAPGAWWFWPSRSTERWSHDVIARKLRKLYENAASSFWNICDVP